MNAHVTELVGAAAPAIADEELLHTHRLWRAQFAAWDEQGTSAQALDFERYFAATGRVPCRDCDCRPARRGGTRCEYCRRRRAAWRQKRERRS